MEHGFKFTSALADELAMPGLPPDVIFLNRINTLAANCSGKEVSELTAGESFAIAFLAGVPIKSKCWHIENFMTSIETVPCAITKIDGKFHVAYQEQKT